MYLYIILFVSFRYVPVKVVRHITALRRWVVIEMGFHLVGLDWSGTYLDLEFSWFGWMEWDFDLVL